MKQIEKISMARIFADLIKADLIIDAGEMFFFDKMKAKYHFGREEETEAVKMSFAEAVSVLLQMNDDAKSSFLSDCADLTLSDGYCAKSEALIMMALDYSFNRSTPENPVEVISIPRKSFDIDLFSVLYIETSYNLALNEEIQTHHRELYNELKLAGFDFVYIPRIVQHFQQTDNALLLSVASFLAPSLGEENIKDISKRLLQMTSAKYTKEILCNKFEMATLRESKPSLLIKIGNSYVGDTCYANYLKLPLESDICSIVKTLTNAYSSMQIGNFVVNKIEARYSEKQFSYSGFYKHFFDAYLQRKNIRSRIYIDPFNEKISFPDIEHTVSGMHRREKALYMLFLILSQSGGFSFRQPKNIAEMEEFQSRMSRLQKQYNFIYELFGGDGRKAPDLSLPELRRPMFSCIKKCISHLAGQLYNVNDYFVNKSPSGNLKIYIEKDLIFTKDYNRKGYIRLDESSTWDKINGLSI